MGVSGEIRRAVTTLLTTGPIQVRKDTERKGSVTVRWTKKSGVKWWIGDAPKDLVLKETTCGLDFEVPADGFYQVNTDVGEELAKAVVAEYYARIFFRNSVATGEVYPFETATPLVAEFKTGDEAELDTDAHTLTRLSDGKVFPLKDLGAVAPVVEAGGMFAYARAVGMIPSAAR